MNKLYTDLAEVYEAMYATFINYQEEYDFYSKILNRYHKKDLLEIGSGTGKLAAIFKQNGFGYSGIDLSDNMIAIAKKHLPDCQFAQADMRSFEIEEPVNSAIMTGRTISYLLTNEDVNNTLKSIHKSLKSGGIFTFDFIDANRFIPDLMIENKVIHEASYKGVDYLREGIWELKMKDGMDFSWHVKYCKKEGDQLIELGTDTEEVRSFTKNELELFLTVNGFEVKEIIDRATYFFPTYVIVAEKK